MTIKKVLRDFIKWQIKNDMLKDKLTIDYEIAESYLEENKQMNVNRTVTLTVKHISHTESVLINSAGHTFTFNPDKHEGLADFIGSGD